MKKNKITSEKILEKYLSSEVKKINGLCFKLAPLFLSGIPDRVCLFKNGEVLFIELKTTNAKATKLQLYWHKKIKQLGFKIEIIDNYEKLKKIIEKYNYA